MNEYICRSLLVTVTDGKPEPVQNIKINAKYHMCMQYSSKYIGIPHTG